MGARFFADVSAEKNPAGSISVFFAILLPLVCSLFFSMLEVTRIRGLDVNSRQMALQMLENTFSEYQPLLWQQYGILALDMGYASGEGDIAKVAARMMEFGTWYDQAVGGDGQERFLALSPGGCEITAYELLTDHGAVALIRQGARTAGEDTALETIRQWIGQADDTSEGQSSDLDIGKLVDQGKMALDQVKAQQKEAGEAVEETDVSEPVPAEEGKMPQDNPFDLFREWEEKGLLALVMDPERSLPEAAVDPSAMVSGRDLAKGTAKTAENATLVERVLFGQYLLQRFATYRQSDGVEEGTGLRYQVEHVIGGKGADRENLEAVVARILLLREVQNVIAIASDSKKMGQALEAATALAGFTGNPAIIQLVQAAVVGVWAFVESVLDIRLLLEGGKVPVVKNGAQWTSDLFCLGQYVSPKVRAKNGDDGMTYEDYLRGMLAVLPSEELGLRACDVMENTLCGSDTYAMARMDEMIVSVEAVCVSQGDPVFFRLISLKPRNVPSYSFAQEVSLSY